MPKKVKEKKSRKKINIKVSGKKNKIKVIKSKLKIVDESKKNKDFKGENLDNNLEEESFESIDLESSLRNIGAPVLRRSRHMPREQETDLEEELSNVPAQRAEERDERFSYTTSQGGEGYITTAGGAEEGNNFHYTEMQDTQRMLQNEENRETRNLVTRGEYNPGDRNKEIERMPGVETNRETRKYLLKGDKK